MHDSYLQIINEILVKVYVLQKCLESRYSSWVLDGNMLPVSIDPFVIESNPSYDFYIGKSSELFFARASARKDAWDNDFISNFAMMVHSQLVKLQGINFGFVMTVFGTEGCESEEF